RPRRPIRPACPSLSRNIRPPRARTTRRICRLPDGNAKKRQQRGEKNDESHGMEELWLNGAVTLSDLPCFGKNRLLILNHAHARI
ncbi:MAG TPA: hypothetical protein VK530_08025, partial [Candidatus Acidoferrum sp.]|nr:hypothetical protein [Candidatus Acidoferrum sp.]